MAFGYDRPLQEYFVQVYDEKDELLLDYNSNGFSMVSNPDCQKRLSNTAMYELIVDLMDEKDFSRHSNNLEKILLDLPI